MSELDQFIMEDVARYCPREFVEYHKCISANRNDLQQCSFRQRDLSSCIQANVPSVQRVMKNCGSIMQNYERCVKEHMETHSVNDCVPLLTQMRSCASEHALTGTRPINEMTGDQHIPK